MWYFRCPEIVFGPESLDHLDLKENAVVPVQSEKWDQGAHQDHQVIVAIEDSLDNVDHAVRMGNQDWQENLVNTKN